jgi:hypothetical protein
MTDTSQDPNDAYICYNSADLSWVQTLAEQLESETIDGNPDSRKLRVFFDKWDIEAGQSLIDRMNQGMNAARHVITILSPQFLNADWPRFEWKNMVAQDPNNTRGVIIPIMLRNMSSDGKQRIDLCAPFRDLRYIDFQKHSEFKRCFIELVRRIRNQPAERGRKLTPLAGAIPVLPTPTRPEVSWLPDKVQEVLLSNLLPVKSLPNRIWGAETKCRERKEVWEIISPTEPFILKEGRLYTFADLNSAETKVRAAINPNTILPVARNDWFLHASKSLWLMSLLNMVLNSHLRLQGIKRDGKGRFIFMPDKYTGGDRTWILPGGRKRSVAAKKVSADKTSVFWVHHGAEIAFKRLGEQLFLAIEPHYLFTTDGTVSIEGKGAGKLAMIWGGKQQNPDILRNIIFWGYVLSNNGTEVVMETGAQPITAQRLPASTQMDIGIASDEIRIATLFDRQDKDLDVVAATAEFAADYVETEDEEDEKSPEQ